MNEKKLIKAITVEANAKGVDIPDTKNKSIPELEVILNNLKTPPPPPPPEKVADETGTGGEATGEADETGTGGEATGEADETGAGDEVTGDADDVETGIEKNIDEDDDPEPNEKPAFPYSIAPGKAITTKRGILADGEEITKNDLDGDAFNKFIKSGYIKKG